ncbi:hypothetical protein PAPHI01_1855 [Pancytospora philotis]|nr:hypothetical protein PAPHI01_1855 [Pancytospora philotis]
MRITTGAPGLTRRARKAAKIEASAQEATKLKLVNKLVITNRNPTKAATKLCKQLRETFAPDCLTHIKDKHPRIKDYLEMADAHMISQIVVVSDKLLQIGCRPSGPTYSFRIVDYKDDFKKFSPELFRQPPFVTFDGRSDLKPVFERLGKNEPGFKRTLHFLFDGDRVLMRHYSMKQKDDTDNFVMGLREIGPSLTLELVKTEEGLFQSARASASKSKPKD